ncbi:MAG: sigma-54 dependent transcriptional regulator [Sedimenticolaceae bacterium]
MKTEVCLIEDDPIMGESLVERMQLEGYDVTLFPTGTAALGEIPKRNFAALVSDIKLPDMPGDEVFRRLSRQMIAVPPTIFITGYGTIDQAVSLLRLGAADYQTKPLNMGQFLKKLGAVCRRPQIDHQSEPRLGISRAMREIEATIARLVRYPEATVLIEGETGVGKEIIAGLLHELQCPGHPFEAVNCAALPEGLAASELFGHVRGAFTGAAKAHAGALERAGSGVLFLDEIGDMPLDLQAQLLRALQQRHFMPVGGERQRTLNARIVCATHRDLLALVKSGDFREDLYYRINVVQIHVPPLRERPEDTIWLAERFLAESCQRHGEQVRALSGDSRAALITQPWPGNARELKHHIERACILSDQPVISPNQLELRSDTAPETQAGDLRQVRQQEEKRQITAALAESNGKVGEAAKLLGISRKSLWEKRKRYGL